MKLLPKEPTQEMLTAGLHQTALMHESLEAEMLEVYTAMYKATPDVEYEPVGKISWFDTGWIGEIKLNEFSEDSYVEGQPLHTHPQPKCEPLSEEEALKILSDIPYHPVPTIDIVRSIEKVTA